MATEYILGRMAGSTKDNISATKNKGTAFTLGQMVENMQDSGSMASKKEKDSIQHLTA